MYRKIAWIARLEVSESCLIPVCDLRWSAVFRPVITTGEIFSISMCDAQSHGCSAHPGGGFAGPRAGMTAVRSGQRAALGGKGPSLAAGPRLPSRDLGAANEGRFVALRTVHVRF